MRPRIHQMRQRIPCRKVTKMAPLLPFEFPDFSALGRNLLVGASIGLGLGVGIGAGIVVARKFVTFRINDGRLVVCMTELTQEIRGLRTVLCAQRQSIHIDQKPRTVKRVKSANSLDREPESEEDTDDTFFEMSGEELSDSERLFGFYFVCHSLI